MARQRLGYVEGVTNDGQAEVRWQAVRHRRRRRSAVDENRIAVVEPRDRVGAHRLLGLHVYGKLAVEIVYLPSARCHDVAAQQDEAFWRARDITAHGHGRTFEKPSGLLDAQQTTLRDPLAQQPETIAFVRHAALL